MDVVYQCKAPPQTHRAGAVQVYHYSHYYIVQKLDANHRVGAVSSSNLVFYAQSTSVVYQGGGAVKVYHYSHYYTVQKYALSMR